jgi:hypothetical protein
MPGGRCGRRRREVGDPGEILGFRLTTEPNCGLVVC